MLIQNGGYNTRYSRITWDGNKVAGYGVAQWWNTKSPTNHDGAAEHTDEVFQDVGVGIFAGRLGRQYGEMGSEGQIRRVTFVRNWIAGVNTGSWNALDWWIWDSRFIDCARGYTNKFSVDDKGSAVGAGAAYIYRTSFERSTIADVDIRNTMWFSLHNNVSIGSKLFFLGDSVGRNGAEIILMNNKIYDPVSIPAIVNKNLGPLILIDNNFYVDYVAGFESLLENSLPGADAVLIGNKAFSRNSHGVGTSLQNSKKNVEVRSASFDNNLYLRKKSDVGRGFDFKTPDFEKGVVFEIPVNADAGKIQDVVNEAASCSCVYPIVHFPSGLFRIEKPIVIPAMRSMGISGDGLATVLDWVGPSGYSIFEIKSPSRVSIRDLEFVALNAYALNISDADQSAGRIFMIGSTPGKVVVDSLRRTQLTMQANSEISRLSINNSTNVVSIGGGGSGPTLNLTGDSSALFADTWYEGGDTQLFNISSGDFTFIGGLLAPGTHIKDRGPVEHPTILFSDYKGKALFLGLKFQLAKIINNKGVYFAGLHKESNVLFLGVSSNKKDYIGTSSDGAVGVVSSKSIDGLGVSAQLENYGFFDHDSIRMMLMQARSLKWDVEAYKPPVGATDIIFYRVMSVDTLGINISGDGQAKYSD